MEENIKSLPKLISALQRNFDDAKMQYETANKSLSLANPLNLRNLYTDYALDFKVSVLSVLRGVSNRKHGTPDWTSTDEGSKGFAPSKLGRTFSELIADATKYHSQHHREYPKWHNFVSVEELKNSPEHFKGVSDLRILDDLDKKIYWPEILPFIKRTF